MATLSILLLCWNHARFLPRAVESLVAQTSRDFDIVFLDNASTDGSAQLAETLLSKTGIPFRSVRNATPQGISANFNELLRLSSGELVAPLSTDDWYDPAYVEMMVEAAAASPGAGWLSCLGWREYEDSGNRIAIDPATLSLTKPVAETILAGEEPFFFVGCCYRRAALDTVGGWDEAMPIEDRDLFYRLGKRFEHVNVLQPLVHYRMHGTAVSANQQYMIDGWEKFYAKHKADFTPRRLRQQRAEMYRRAAAVMVDQMNLDEARRELMHSAKLHPLSIRLVRTFAYWITRAISVSMLARP